jgi:hypothetical protein
MIEHVVARWAGIGVITVVGSCALGQYALDDPHRTIAHAMATNDVVGGTLVPVLTSGAAAQVEMIGNLESDVWIIHAAGAVVELRGCAIAPPRAADSLVRLRSVSR